MTTTQKVKVKSVWLARAEGRPEECIALVVDSIEAADAVLLRWSETAPGGPGDDLGGYDKCDFEITFEDGEKYEGRYDLVHWSKEMPSLARHVLSFLRFHAGLWCPPHLTPTQYEDALTRFEKFCGHDRDEYVAFLDKYEIA